MNKTTCRFIIMILSLMSVCLPTTAQRTEWNALRGYEGWKNYTAEGVRLSDEAGFLKFASLPENINSSDFTLNFRVANTHNHPARLHVSNDGGSNNLTSTMPGWQLQLLYPANGNATGNDTVSIKFRTEETGMDASANQYLHVSAFYNNRIIRDTLINSGIDLYRMPNAFSLHSEKGKLFLRGGNREYRRIMSLSIPDRAPVDIRFGVEPAGEIILSDISLVRRSSPSAEKQLTESEINTIISTSADPVTGYWVMFDRKLEEKYLRRGGNYTVLIIPDQKDYLILYVDGAEKNKQSWEPYMKKGILRSTPFSGIYDVEWNDAAHTAIETEMKATVKENVLTILFPYLDSEIRFVKTQKK